MPPFGTLEREVQPTSIAKTNVGGLLHFLVCVPMVRKKWGPFRINTSIWSNPQFRTMTNELQKVVAIGIFAQLNIIVLRNIASELPTGSITQYWYANRVVDLSQGVIAVAVGSALLPYISKAAKDQDWQAFEDYCVQSIRIAACVLLPAAGLIFVLSDPIVFTLFKNGEFSEEGASKTAETLVCLIPFMLSVAGINILKKPYFALNRRDLLMAVACLGLLLTLALGWFFAFYLNLGVQGLGLGLSASTFLQFVVYLVLLYSVIGASIGVQHLVMPLFKMLICVVPAAGIAWGISLLGSWSEGFSILNFIILGAATSIAMVVFFSCAWGLGVRQEVNTILHLGMLSKLGKRFLMTACTTHLVSLFLRGA